jgi:tRNA nucleotidyltransferase (CCA-adding enzyme)
MPDQRRIDVATARLEYYEHPAAMPTVEFGSIKLDLYRRDFTINAMAIHINPDRFGSLVDFFNSQNDLKERRIRVLQNLSFVEDPTRIFRAVRFEQRLNFAITKHSEKLIKNAVRMNLFDRFFGARFFQELRYILSGDNPIPALQRLSGLGLFPFLWPDLRPNLKIDRRFLHVLIQASRAIAWYKLLYRKERCTPWKVFLLAIMSRSKSGVLYRFCRRFELSERQSRTLIRQKETAERIGRDMLRRSHLLPSEAYWLLQDLDINGLLYLMAIARKTRIQKSVSLYVTTLRATCPLLDGEDMQEMGYNPGPLFRTMLNALLEAQLDGKLTTREQAKDFLLQEFPPDQQHKKNTTTEN